MFGTTNTGTTGIQFQNTSVQFTLQSTPDYADYPYRGQFANSGITATSYADVVYSGTQASSGNYAPFCQTYDGGVWLYARTNVGTQIIPTIAVGTATLANIDVGLNITRNSNTSIATGRWQGGYDSTKIIYLSRNDQNCQVYIIPPDSNQAVCVGNSWDTNNSGGSRTFTFILPKGWFYVYFSTSAYTNVIAFDTATAKVAGNLVSVGQTYTDNGPYIHVFDFGVGSE